MKIYEYQCQASGTRFERYQSCREQVVTCTCGAVAEYRISAVYKPRIWFTVSNPPEGVSLSERVKRKTAEGPDSYDFIPRTYR